MLRDARQALVETDAAPGRPVRHLIVGARPTFRRRSSIGSMSRRPASSSRTCSRANVACGAPGARYAPVPTRFVSTPNETTSCAAQRYGPTVRIAAMPSMLPSEKAPVSKLRRARRPSEAPVACRAGGQLEDAGRRRVAHPEVLEAGQLDPDGPAEHERGRGRQRVRDEDLAAEPAAERRAGHPDAGRSAGRTGATAPTVSRTCPAWRSSGGGRRRGRARPMRDLRLDVALVDPAGREPALDDDVARRERRVDVAAPESRSARRRCRTGPRPG